MSRSTGVKLLAAALAAAASGSAVAAAGDLDCSFGVGGKVVYDLGSIADEEAADIALQPDGRMVLVGSDGASLRLTRLTRAGDLDPTFGANGTIVHAFPGLSFTADIALDASGRIVVAGNINTPDSEAFVARFTDTGAPDPSFGGGDGWTSFDFAAATANAGQDLLTGMVLDGSGRPVVVGKTDPNGPVFFPSNSDIAVARLTLAGELDASFSGDGLATVSTPGAVDDEGREVKIDPSGRIVAVGNTWTGATNQLPRNSVVARWLADGTPDAALDGDGLLVVDLSQAGVDDFAIDLAFSGGKLLVLATGAGDDPLLGRFNENGSFDTTFAGDGALQRSFLGGQDVTEHVVVQADGKLIVTGWPVVGSSFQFASMRFLVDGTLDTTWGGTGVVTTNLGFPNRAYGAVVQPDGRLVLAGSIANDTQLALARYLADGEILANLTTTAITSDTPDPSDPNQDVTVGVSVTSTGLSVAPTGQFAVTDGAGSCIGTLVPGAGVTSTGSCILALPVGGARTLTASYDGGASQCRSSGTAPHAVNRAPVALAITGDTPDPSVTGDTVAVTWSLQWGGQGTQVGAVSVSDGVNSCSAAIAAGGCSLVLNTSGTRPLVARFAGNASFLPAESAAEPHVVKVRLTPSAGANGAISPSTPQLYDRNDVATFTLSPAPGFHADTVTGCTGTLAGNTWTSAPLTTSCNVAATFNADPVAVPGDQFVLEDSGANAAQLFASDADPLVFSIVTPPTKGTVAITNAATGEYTYTPAPNAVGADAFTFRARDANGSSAVTAITIGITAVNDAPSFTTLPVPDALAGTTGAQSLPGFATFDAGPPDEDATQSATWLLDAVDDPSGVLVAASVGIAANGTLGYTLTGTPGTATLTLRVRDDGGTANGGADTSTPQTATITVAAAADLQVAKDDGRTGVVSGDTTTYAIVATNAGPSAVAGALLEDELPATLVNASWSCRAELSTVPCPAAGSGTGDLSVAVDLPVGGVLRFDLTATVDGATGAFVTNVATIATPAGTTSLDASNDSATDQDVIVPEGVFLDGFEQTGTGVTVPEAAAVLRR